MTDQLTDALDVHRVFDSIHQELEVLEDEIFDQMSRGTFWTKDEIVNASSDVCTEGATDAALTKGSK